MKPEDLRRAAELLEEATRWGIINHREEAEKIVAELRREAEYILRKAAQHE